MQMILILMQILKSEKHIVLTIKDKDGHYVCIVVILVIIIFFFQNYRKGLLFEVTFKMKNQTIVQETKEESNNK